MTPSTPSIRTHHAPSEIELARSLADDIGARLDDAIRQRGKALLCVSGGRSPIALFEALSQTPLDWSRVTVSLVDERCVPLSHADSNAGLVSQHLLMGHAAAARFIGLVPPDMAEPLDAAQWADAAEARLRPLWPADVAVLGMGPDGHTASIFPGASNIAALLDRNGAPLCAAVQPPDAPHRRITLTLSALLAVRHLALQISGAAKLAVYQQALQAAVPELPISFLLAQPGVSLDVWVGPG